MNLQEFQHKMLGLIKSSYEPDNRDEVYLQELRTSQELDLVKEVCVWWRCFQIENYCPLTSAWLKQRSLFEVSVEQFYQNTNVSSYVERAGKAFLKYVLSQNIDSIASSVANFELSIILVKTGDKSEHIITWHVEPYAVLDSLLHKTRVKKVTVQQQYKVTVSHKIPELFKVVIVK